MWRWDFPDMLRPRVVGLRWAGYLAARAFRHSNAAETRVSRSSYLTWFLLKSVVCVLPTSGSRQA